MTSLHTSINGQLTPSAVVTSSADNQFSQLLHIDANAPRKVFFFFFTLLAYRRPQLPSSTLAPPHPLSIFFFIPSALMPTGILSTTLMTNPSDPTYLTVECDS